MNGFHTTVVIDINILTILIYYSHPYALIFKVSFIGIVNYFHDGYVRRISTQYLRMV